MRTLKLIISRDLTLDVVNWLHRNDTRTTVVHDLIEKRVYSIQTINLADNEYYGTVDICILLIAKVYKLLLS